MLGVWLKVIEQYKCLRPETKSSLTVYPLHQSALVHCYTESLL